MLFEPKTFGPRAAVNRLKEGKRIVSSDGHNVYFMRKKRRSQGINGYEVWRQYESEYWVKVCNIKNFAHFHKSFSFRILIY